VLAPQLKNNQTEGSEHDQPTIARSRLDRALFDKSGSRSHLLNHTAAKTGHICLLYLFVPGLVGFRRALRRKPGSVQAPSVSREGGYGRLGVRIGISRFRVSGTEHTNQ